MSESDLKSKVLEILQENWNAYAQELAGFMSVQTVKAFQLDMVLTADCAVEIVIPMKDIEKLSEAIKAISDHMHKNVENTS